MSDFSIWHEDWRVRAGDRRVSEGPGEDEQPEPVVALQPAAAAAPMRKVYEGNPEITAIWTWADVGYVIKENTMLLLKWHNVFASGFAQINEFWISANLILSKDAAVVGGAITAPTSQGVESAINVGVIRHTFTDGDDNEQTIDVPNFHDIYWGHTAEGSLLVTFGSTTDNPTPLEIYEIDYVDEVPEPPPPMPAGQYRFVGFDGTGKVVLWRVTTGDTQRFEVVDLETGNLVEDDPIHGLDVPPGFSTLHEVFAAGPSGSTSMYARIRVGNNYQIGLLDLADGTSSELSNATNLALASYARLGSSYYATSGTNFYISGVSLGFTAHGSGGAAVFMRASSSTQQVTLLNSTGSITLYNITTGLFTFGTGSIDISSLTAQKIYLSEDNSVAYGIHTFFDTASGPFITRVEAT